MQLLTAIVILRLGAFAIGCMTYGLASYHGWPYAGWLLVPIVITGAMCASLGVSDNDDCKCTHSSTQGGE